MCPSIRRRSLSLELAMHDGQPSVRGYWAGCRCRGCRLARAAYEHQRRRDGHLVPVDRIIAHLKRVPGNIKAIARQAGITFTTLKNIKRRRRLRVQKRVADRLLALPPRRVTALVPSYRTKRLLQALRGEDWTIEQIADELDMPRSALRCRFRNIRATTAAKVEALYQRFESDEWTGERQQPRR